jgi:hypothetical protein
MKKKMIVILSLFALSAGAAGLYATDHTHFGTAVTNSHSGGTDADGCHTNHKTGYYHCHKRKR